MKNVEFLKKNFEKKDLIKKSTTCNVSIINQKIKTQSSSCRTAGTFEAN